LYNEIETGTIETGKLQCVFLLIYCRDGKPYKKYSLPNGRTLIPKVLSLSRHDGFVGFIGGKVDPGETLIEGLLREVKEETGLILNHNFKIEPLVTYSEPEANIHSFSLEVTEMELKDMTAVISSSDNFGVEITGFALNHIEEYVQSGGVGQVLTQNWKCTSKFELEELIKQKKLLV
jgi:ADP-ribose pyrophosphatase